jgi:hypothetical protein
MKIVEECYGKIKFQVKIKNKYVTVATLQAGWRECEVYFSYYGDEYKYGGDHVNGSSYFTITIKPYETRSEMIERAANIVRKKLYQIADGILNDIKVTD